MSETTITLRRALPTDYFRIVDMWKSSMRSTFRPFMSEEKLAAWADGRRINNSVWSMMRDMLVASEGARVIGIAAFCGRHLDLLWVALDRRDEGIGSRLIGAAERAIADLGHDTLSLEVFEENKGAIRFYERHGWVKYDVYFDRSTGTRKVKMIKHV